MFRSNIDSSSKFLPAAGDTLPHLWLGNAFVRHRKFSTPMSALGQKQKSAHVSVMSALPPKADIGTKLRDVRFVPEADDAVHQISTLLDLPLKPDIDRGRR
jgi:hypothetical protein